MFAKYFKKLIHKRSYRYYTQSQLLEMWVVYSLILITLLVSLLLPFYLSRQPTNAGQESGTFPTIEKVK